MRDYSKYIQSSYGFITRYEVIDGKIYVYTAESKKDEPHVYPGTKEWIASVESRLEKQYNMLINNRDAIMEDYLKKCTKPIKVIFGLLIALCLLIGGVSSLQHMAIYPLIYSLSASVFSYAIATGLVYHKRFKFEDELNLIENFVKNKKDMEKINSKDQNVTSHLSPSSMRMYNDKAKLKELGIIDYTFNIDFMDSMSLKDLKNLLTRYFICKGLKSEQTYVDPYEERVKRRKRVKKNTSEIEEV